MFLIVIPITLVTLLYIWMKWKYSFWQRHKVLGPKPSFFVGNIGQTFTFSEHWGIIAENWYKAYSNEPYIGYYKMLQPAIVACDPDLVKDIMITKFNSFRDNDSRISEKFDPLLKANPFFNSDEEWKELRKQLSPMFSPSKLKNVMPVMNEVGEEFANFIKSQLKNNEFNAKDLCMRFTTQNLAKCAFSIDPGCFGDGQDSEFVTMLKELFEPSFLVGLKFLAWPIMPKWALDLIPLPFVPKSTDHFLRDMTRTNKTSRTNNVKSHDFFQLLLELQSKYNFTDGMLTGHVLSLFTEGTETSNTTMSYVLYELAKHPDCQEKLFDDITTILNKYDGKLSFEALQEITYLECVVLETLRIDSPVLTLQKVCTEYFTLPKNNKQTKPVTIAPGTVVTIPVQAIHMDPKNYPNPEVFDPERFTEEEQRNRHKGIFLSFGEGPRICPGMRFGIAQSKLAILYIVKNFRIKLSPNHKPIVIDPQTLMSYPKDGILIQFEAR